MSAAERTCECGCGTPVANRFVQGHALRTPEYKAALAAGRRRTDFEAAHGTRKRNDEIRARMSRGESQTDLAAEYGVSPQRIEQIYRKGRSLARAAVRGALKRGDLAPPDRCERCPSSGPLESHHADYSRPLEVQWLCRLCHAAADEECRRSRGEQRRRGQGPRLRRRRSLAVARQERAAKEREARREARLRERERTRIQLLRDMAEVAIIVGHTPCQAELDARLSYSWAQFVHYFGSLRKAQTLAGLTPNGLGGHGHGGAPLPPNIRQVVERLRDELRCAA